METIQTIHPISALIATGLSLHGLRKGSLSPSGAGAAWAVGYAHLANPSKIFGVAMIVFYLLGSRATKVKAEVKSKLEDGVDASKPGGNRNAVQVLSNSTPSLIAALVYRFVASDSITPITPLLSTPFPRGLLFLSLAHFSTVLADTLASELGILSTSSPRHVLTFSPVPPGTNGGVSPLGLAVSALGGGLMGVVYAIVLGLERGGLAGINGWSGVGELLVFGTATGLLGSLLDSVLGALFQRTLYDTTTNRILTDASTRPRSGPEIKQIGFGREILSNSGVNFVTSCLMAAAGWWYASL